PACVGRIAAGASGVKGQLPLEEQRCGRQQRVRAAGFSACRSSDLRLVTRRDLAKQWRGGVILGVTASNRKAGPASARRTGVRIVHLERSTDQIVDEIEFCALKEIER